jgi:hypothetical protein
MGLREPRLKGLLKDYRHLVERRFARPDDAESYAGGSVSFR